MSKTLLRVACALAVMGASQAADADGLDPRRLLADIKREGVAKVEARIGPDTSRNWKTAEAGVESGDPDWLAFAVAFRPLGNVAMGEELSYAISAALKRNAAAALRIVGPQLTLQDLCTVPLIEPKPAELAAWKKQALAALAKIDDPGLAGKAKACSDLLKAVK